MMNTLQMRAELMPFVSANEEFHVTNVMLHLLQIKGFFGGQPYEDVNLHLNNFMDVCLSFDIAPTYQESIYLHIFPFSLTEEVVLWLWEFPMGSTTLWVELIEAFLD